jgi:hypothetical protein
MLSSEFSTALVILDYGRTGGVVQLDVVELLMERAATLDGGRGHDARGSCSGFRLQCQYVPKRLTQKDFAR